MSDPTPPIGEPLSESERLNDELAGLKWLYLNDPKFHALVTLVVRGKHTDLVTTIDRLKEERDEANTQVARLTEGRDTWRQRAEEAEEVVGAITEVNVRLAGEVIAVEAQVRAKQSWIDGMKVDYDALNDEAHDHAHAAAIAESRAERAERVVEAARGAVDSLGHVLAGYPDAIRNEHGHSIHCRRCALETALAALTDDTKGEG